MLSQDGDGFTMVKTGERKIENKMTGKLATSVGGTSTGERRDCVGSTTPWSARPRRGVVAPLRA